MTLGGDDEDKTGNGDREDGRASSQEGGGDEEDRREDLICLTPLHRSHSQFQMVTAFSVRAAPVRYLASAQYFFQRICQ